ncbi:flavodoxin [Clostridium carboxidivorans P7]|uniref:NAD(P)H dehydrogenase (Quinone) n=1 Tax=Clostridium carboxidivorans P7 TaxID=536227 RepID=C6PV40_9CLOT|nr:flavodoxin family protein [Clostridium carboxidivorans]AKN33810.1 flavodoxin [Clostridium carboxidivorans P7]EET86858.1 NAD(P)H dehydrogenase (quinone) [Clostridium carboxidivorans P7]EFG86579.1 flavodoxin-like fold protein [Clostridium carboxidivorans P7]
MKVLVLTGSPHKKGTSSLLADEFIRGAKESGNEVSRFDAAFEDVHPCIGCGKCENGKNSCVFKDDINKLNPLLLEADRIVFVSPVYSWGLTAQLKAVIDRAFMLNAFSIQKNKKAMLMVTCASGEEWITDPVEAQYNNILKFMEWEDAGRILARGCAARPDIEVTDFPRLAYEAGKNIAK